jgi:HAD superfamily hydrolase (TIGR01509 family)
MGRVLLLMNKIETVFFDMGGTLETLAYDDALRRRASGALRQFLLDHDLDPRSSSEAFHESVIAGLAAYKAWGCQSLVELPADRICAEFVLRDFGFLASRLHDIGDEFMLLLETTFYDRRERPEAKNVLESLQRAGLRLGIISNVMSPECVDVNLARYGLLDYFDTVVASSRYGRRKPDPRIFLYAAQEIGSPPERCAHVGDKTSRDILGAVGAGYGLAIRIEHPEIDGTEPREPVADAVIDDLTGVVDIIARTNVETAGARPTANGSIKAILFDAGDILYYRPRRGQHLGRFLESHSLRAQQVPGSEQKAMKDRAMTGEVSKREYMEYRLRSMGIEDTDQFELAIAALEKESNDVAFFDGARETLAELKRRGYRLGIVTDTYHARETKLEWLRRNGIDRIWDVFVSSCEEGVRKPDPAIYRAALDQLGLEPSEASFVGHKRSELDGAIAVGLKTIAFNYEAEAKADHFIEHFSELLTLFPSADGKE